MNVYNRGKQYGTAQLATFTIKAMLLKSSYVFNADHDFITDTVPASNELTDASYARQTLAGLANSIDDTKDRAALDSNDVTFALLAGGEEIAGIAFFRFVTNDSDSELLFFQPLSPSRTSDGTDFKLIINVLGLVIVEEGDITLADVGIVENGFGNLSAGALTVVLSTSLGSTDYVPKITPTANEIMWVDEATKTVSSFKILSSNPTSTAKVYWEVSL